MTAQDALNGLGGHRLREYAELLQRFEPSRLEALTASQWDWLTKAYSKPRRSLETQMERENAPVYAQLGDVLSLREQLDELVKVVRDGFTEIRAEGLHSIHAAWNP